MYSGPTPTSPSKIYDGLVLWLDANDVDGDGLCADNDNCPNHNNPGQEDSENTVVGGLVSYWEFDECSGNRNGNPI